MYNPSSNFHNMRGFASGYRDFASSFISLGLVILNSL